MFASLLNVCSKSGGQTSRLRENPANHFVHSEECCHEAWMALSMVRFVVVACAGCCHMSVAGSSIYEPPTAKDKLPEGIPQDISDGGFALGFSHCNWAKCKVLFLFLVGIS